eukprot:gene26412-35060_t
MIVDSIGSNLMTSIVTCASTSNEYAAYAYSYYGNPSESNCYFFDGINDCDKIFTTYTPNLAASVTFDTLCFAKKAPTFRNELSRNGKADSVRNPIREAVPSGSDKEKISPVILQQMELVLTIMTLKVAVMVVQGNLVLVKEYQPPSLRSLTQKPVSTSHTLPASTSKESVELKKITTAQLETTDNGITGPSTEGKVNRRSSISRKRVPPLPPTHTGASSSSPKTNDVKEMEVNSPVPQVASLMKVFNQFPVEEEGTTPTEVVDNSFSQDYSSSSVVDKRNTSDETLERELKKDLDAFQPTQALDK